MKRLRRPTRAPSVLTINGGSSSIKFAFFAAGSPNERILSGRLEGIGRPSPQLVTEHLGAPGSAETVAAADHGAAARTILAWVREHIGAGAIQAIGHRFVHGGPQGGAPRLLSGPVLARLRRATPMDPEHLPDELALAEAVGRAFPGVPQVACFDTAFHSHLPAEARLLPIPRRYEKKGVRRYGFHGLSYEFLLKELARLAGARAARGRIILAHLGSGASLAAVRHGRSLDTSMAFTPAAGIPMATRSGDLDPGLGPYFARTEGMSARAFNRMVTTKSGLLGMSGTSSDVRDLLRAERSDPRAAEALAVFCYQAKKWIGAYAAALGGLETLVFAGGIGEHSAPIRARICADLGFLGLVLDSRRNRAGAGVISAPRSRVSVRVIPTDEEAMIAHNVRQLLRRTAFSSHSS